MIPNELQTHSITNNNVQCPETETKPKPNEWPKMPQYTKCFFNCFASPASTCVYLFGWLGDLFNKIFVCATVCWDWIRAENKRFNFIRFLKWQQFPYAAIVHCIVVLDSSRDMIFAWQRDVCVMWQGHKLLLFPFLILRPRP